MTMFQHKLGQIQLKLCLKQTKVKKKEEEKNEVNRYILHQKDFFSLQTLSNVFANATKTLFARFSININFLSKNPTTWNDDPGYESGLEKLQKTVVMNGIAESGVKLIQEYNTILTKDETEKQFVLQLVNENRENYPSATKYSLKKK